ncbi:hypothetical protein vBYenPRambo_009 [Yersinia phage vB_YenP_Rambo]|uniref:Uncharacterized protein n=1 Tax=Yersinia phage vB_YenP_Rambo TaxID=2880894 RepID=A0AC61TNW8_9CAUD|nr:hypothetical protein vBYenPRambo_009 [Yersinia phage vB_YenP_Rambo]
MFRLHFNKSHNNFSIRRTDRSIVGVSGKADELPLIGSTVALAPRVHILITRNDFKKAMDKKRPVLNVAVTRFPFVRLLIQRIKEVF